MEADSQSRPAPPEFTPRQMELIGALPKVGNRFPLASMFKGALIAMKQENNPEAFVHAALSLRELIVNFERTINLPLSGYETEKDAGFVKVNVGHYAGRWSDTKSVSVCFVRDSSSWAGTIDPVLLGFFPLFAIHLCEEVEGQQPEVHGTAAGIEEGDFFYGLERAWLA